MSISRIAIRYAKPLLALAEEQKSIDRVKNDMEQFASLCANSRPFVSMLRSPVIAHLKKAEILNKIFKGKVSDLTLSMFTIIARKSRENILPEFADEFLKLYHEKMGFQMATVATAIPLDKSLKSSVEQLVSKLSGKKPLLTEKVDEKLIGGYILKMGDRQIDQSVKGSLSSLRLKFEKED